MPLLIPRPNYRKRKFIAALAVGGSPRAAAKAAGVGHTKVYEWRDEDPEFAQAWDNAWTISGDLLEDEAHRRGVEGVKRVVGVDKNGNPIEITTYSDKLLMMLLKGRRPDRYANNLTTQHKHSGRVEIVERTKTIMRTRERLISLGVPPPTIETDFEDVTDAAASSNSNITE